ncbi:MAG: aminomethyl-transferring glycine dehydrogenase subunit GcvPB [Planctomycetota bacterium]|jgi:glycine dehydrogenase subunit 2|nr:aminomethyl-transferring glycine dehydrogenase subunit GcvPB [Planctomycetota bacterium]
MSESSGKKIADQVGASGLALNEKLLWERGRPGRSGMSIPDAGVPETPLPAEIAGNGPNWPDLSELEVVRHYTRLSTWNFGVDTGVYPLGSCTMKYNPKINEKMASLPGFAGAHPLLPDDACQGALRVLHEMERLLADIVGLAAASLQPAAGAHGELCGMLMIAAHHRHAGAKKTKILMPDTAHGTNPATAAMCGYREVKVPIGVGGKLELAAVRELMDAETAGIMVTNPNTLGVFESELADISALIHERGGLVYADGANLNAIMGRVDMGKMGVDVVHFNLHKSMSTPHGGGGPGSGPVAVGEALVPYLPGPRIQFDGERYFLSDAQPLSIGRLHGFHGQFGTALRAYSYILSLGPEIRTASGLAVLNANYIRAKLKGHYDLPYDQSCMHECVFTDAKQKKFKVATLDIVKRLIDLGFHPPTVYFPLVVSGALMIEPTETEAKEDLDAFADAMIRIAREAEENPDILHAAPTRTKVGRLDETLAARKPVLTGDMTRD